MEKSDSAASLGELYLAGNVGRKIAQVKYRNSTRFTGIIGRNCGTFADPGLPQASQLSCQRDVRVKMSACQNPARGDQDRDV
jgi:hypothetical protein